VAIGRVAGHPDYTFDGSSKYIPIIFAGKTLEKFYASTTVGAVANTDYVGEVKNVGDKVYIRTVPDITISDYKKGQALDLEQPENPNIEFTIDYAKYFNFSVDDVDKKQMDLAMMEKWSDDAAQQMKITIDTHVLANIYTGSHASNQGIAAGVISADIDFGVATNPLTITRSNIMDVIINAGLALDEQNLPEEGRWIILPSWMIAMFKRSELADASFTGDSVSPTRSGRVGKVDRVTIYNSNLLATVASDGGTGTKCWYPIFGHRSAFAFVSQLTKTEMYRPQDTFSDAMKGLNVYGFGTLQSKALGYLYCDKG